MDSFNTWLGDQPAKYKVITCGNHEYPVEAEPDAWRRRLSNATLLLNESVTIEGIKIWGSLVTPHGGAFAMRNEADRERLWNTIPVDTQILMSHGPPLHVLDGEGGGCAALRRAVIRLKPRLHCFGHVHSAYGTLPTKDTLFVNAAIVDDDFAPSHNPILLDLKV
jgi:Icc-related predicted phosphoesterase